MMDLSPFPRLVPEVVNAWNRAKRKLKSPDPFVFTPSFSRHEYRSDMYLAFVQTACLMVCLRKLDRGTNTQLFTCYLRF
jgi:hypothetical protein